MRYLIIGLLVISLVACTQQAPPEKTEPVAPPESVPEEPPVVETPPTSAPVEAEAETPEVTPSKGDITFNCADGFTPAEMTVAVGSKLVWQNKHTANTVIFDLKNAFRSGPLAPDETYEFTFEEAGTYNYMDSSCKKKGTIIVE